MLEISRPIYHSERKSSDKMARVGVKWRLADLLEKYDISPYQMADEMGGATKTPMVYRLASRKKPPTKVNFSTITSLLNALRTLTGEDITLTDLIEYTPDT